MHHLGPTELISQISELGYADKGHYKGFYESRRTLAWLSMRSSFTQNKPAYAEQKELGTEEAANHFFLLHLPVSRQQIANSQEKHDNPQTI